MWPECSVTLVAEGLIEYIYDEKRLTLLSILLCGGI